MNNRKFKTFQQAFLSINKEIIENPTYKTPSRIGDVQEISNYNYEVSDMSTYEFPNPLIGRLDYDYGSKFYEWMITGSTDPDSLTKDYPNTARFMAKPKSDLLPENFNTFYGPRIIEQLPYIVKELKDNPNSRRAVISILEKTDLLLLDKDETLEFPCADSATWGEASLLSRWRGCSTPRTSFNAPSSFVNSCSSLVSLSSFDANCASSRSERRSSARCAV